MTEKRPFIPRDKPESWCIGIISGMVALLVAGSLLLVGALLNVGVVKSFGTIIFVSCVVIFFLMWIVFMVGLASGKYEVVEEKNWGDQVW